MRPVSSSAKTELSPSTVARRVKVVVEGFPVVTTRLGAEGIPAEAGRDLQFGDDPAGLAEALLRLYAEPALAEAVRRAGRQLVETHYALDALGALTDRIYAEALAEFAPVTR